MGGKVLGNVVGGIVGKLRGGENLMQNANGQEKRQGCNLRSDGELRCPKWEEKREQTNEMQNGGEGEEERRGNANEMQRGWHPTGKVLGNVVGGIVGKLRGGENLMQNGEEAEEERRKMCMYGPD